MRPGLTLLIPYGSVPTCGPIRSASNVSPFAGAGGCGDGEERMAAEMPARVEAVAGATVAEFPWAGAAAAVAALNTAASTLGTQLDARSTMLPTIVDWEGAYRHEFDGACARITGTASGLKETLATLASSIVSGAEGANQAQRSHNQAALEPDAPTSTRRRPGRNIPV